MNDRRTIVAFAIALCWSNGSPTGCAALIVPFVEAVTTEVSIRTTEIRNETRYDDPLRRIVVGAANVARGFLADTEASFVRSVDRARRILTAAVEAPFARPIGGSFNGHENNDDDDDDDDDDDHDHDTSGDGGRRKSADLSPELSDAPNFPKNLADSISRAIARPFEFASNLTSSSVEAIADAARIAAYNGLELLWRFLTTRALPWLRATLDELDRTNALPLAVHSFVQKFDAAYSFAKLLGYLE